MPIGENVKRSRRGKRRRYETLEERILAPCVNSRTVMDTKLLEWLKRFRRGVWDALIERKTGVHVGLEVARRYKRGDDIDEAEAATVICEARVRLARKRSEKRRRRLGLEGPAPGDEGLYAPHVLWATSGEHHPRLVYVGSCRGDGAEHAVMTVYHRLSEAGAVGYMARDGGSSRGPLRVRRDQLRLFAPLGRE